MKLRVVKPGFPEPPKLTQYGTESALQLLLDEAEFEAPQGRVADYIPELSRANADDRGISICYLDGTTLSAGACQTPFTIQSISKTVALLYALESIGPRKVFSRVGKEPTGEPFNSGLRFQVASSAVESNDQRRSHRRELHVPRKESQRAIRWVFELLS